MSSKARRWTNNTGRRDKFEHNSDYIYREIEAKIEFVNVKERKDFYFYLVTRSMGFNAKDNILSLYLCSVRLRIF